LERLCELRDPLGALLTVYVAPPPESVTFRDVLGRLDSILATVHPECTDEWSKQRSLAAIARVRESVAKRWRYWVGRSMIIVADAENVLMEFPLPCRVPERAILGRRTAVRLALRAHQQARPYTIVVPYGQRSWQLDMEGRTVRRIGRFEGFGGTAHRSVIVGGPPERVAEFFATVEVPAQTTIVGTFAVNPYATTADGISVRAHAVMTASEERRQSLLAASFAEQEAAGRAVSRVESCVRAVSDDRADCLVVRGDSPVAGWLCRRCGVMSTYNATCRTCDGPCEPIPDLVEEMVARLLDAGQRVDLATDEFVGPGIAVQLGD
jgi:hypothetical protein